MIFSVPKAGGGYRYYRSPGIFRPVPPRQELGALGVPVDEAAPALPADAAYVGEGAQARGIVASGGSGGLLAAGAALGLIAAGLWYLLR